MQKSKLIIDCDPGLDDLLALVAAAYFLPTSVEAICSSFGNSNVEQTTKNALDSTHLLPQLVCDVYQGASCANFSGLNKQLELHWPTYGDDDGTCGVNLRSLTSDKAFDSFKKNISELYAKLIESPMKHKLLAIAPLTDIANLCRKVDQSKFELYTLGSYFNLCSVEEARLSYNIKLDPDAAKTVFSSFNDITITGLDIYGNWSESTFSDLFDYCMNLNTISAKLLLMAVSAYRQHKMDASALLVDSLPVFAVAHPEIFTWSYGTIIVQTENYPNASFLKFIPDQSVVCDKQLNYQHTVRVATKLNIEMFIDYWLKIVRHI